MSNNDFDRTRSDIQELQRSTNESRQEIDALKKKTAEFVREEAFMAIKESQADLLAKVNTTSGGLQELRGRFEENRYYNEKVLKDISSEKDLLKLQIAGLETQIRALKDKLAAFDVQIRTIEQAIETSGQFSRPVDPAKTEEASPEVKAEASSDSRTKSYEAAYLLFREKNYKESRERFEAFIKEYPKTDLTDNAQFWIAESYYAEKDYENAILSYETLIKKYPESDKVSGGLLKQGYAFAETGDNKTGRIILDKLIEKYPNSKEADLAKKKLAELEKNPLKKR